MTVGRPTLLHVATETRASWRTASQPATGSGKIVQSTSLLGSDFGHKDGIVALVSISPLGPVFSHKDSIAALVFITSRADLTSYGDASSGTPLFSAPSLFFAGSAT
jgi:hypothetical protein